MVMLSFIALAVILGILLFVILFSLYQKASMEKRIRSRNIPIRKLKKRRRKTILDKTIDKLDTDQMYYKFVHSGEILGINNISLYFTYKSLFTLTGMIMGIQLYDKLNPTGSIIRLIIFAIIGFNIVDIILWQGRKKREDSINKQMATFLVNFDTYNKAGLLFEDILDVTDEILEGEFKKELLRFNVAYSLSKDFEETVAEFMKRLGIPEAENIEVKLRQAYYSGIYDDTMLDEKELLEKKVINDLKKQSEVFQLYVGMAMGLLILNLLLWIIYPLLMLVQSGMSNAF